jgi:hypothetical protein
MIGADGKIETDDMCLATVLVMHGFNPIMERRDGQVIWHLSDDEAGDDAQELIEEYVAGACRVDPRRFMREVGNVRKDMYRFLGIDPRVSGASPRRQPSG